MFRSNETCAYYRQNSNGRKDNTGWKMCLMRFNLFKYLPLSNQVHHHPQCHQHFYIVLHLLYFSLSSHNKICQLSLWYGMVWLESEGGADRVTIRNAPSSSTPCLLEVTGADRGR